jgi:hypothetical protein
MDALKEAAHAAALAAHAAALETALSTEDVEELRSSTEAAWRSEQDAERLQAKAVRVCEEAMARAQRMLQRVRATRDTTVLREVGLDAVKTAGKHTLRAMAVHAAAQEGVDVNTRAESAAGEEPTERWLARAAKEGFVETLRALTAAGAEVDHVDENERTALDGAALGGHVEALRALLEAGAEVDHADDNYGETALIGAAWSGHVEATRALLDAGAAVDHADDNYGHMHCADCSSEARHGGDHPSAVGGGGGGGPSQQRRGDCAVESSGIWPSGGHRGAPASWRRHQPRCQQRPHSAGSRASQAPRGGGAGPRGGRAP